MNDASCGGYVFRWTVRRLRVYLAEQGANTPTDTVRGLVAQLAGFASWSALTAASLGRIERAIEHMRTRAPQTLPGLLGAALGVEVSPEDSRRLCDVAFAYVPSKPAEHVLVVVAPDGRPAGLCVSALGRVEHEHGVAELSEYLAHYAARGLPNEAFAEWCGTAGPLAGAPRALLHFGRHTPLSRRPVALDESADDVGAVPFVRYYSTFAMLTDVPQHFHAAWTSSAVAIRANGAQAVATLRALAALAAAGDLSAFVAPAFRLCRGLPHEVVFGHGLFLVSTQVLSAHPALDTWTGRLG